MLDLAGLSQALGELDTPIAAELRQAVSVALDKRERDRLAQAQAERDRLLAEREARIEAAKARISALEASYGETTRAALNALAMTGYELSQDERALADGETPVSFAALRDRTRMAVDERSSRRLMGIRRALASAREELAGLWILSEPGGN
jgi:hypothetical protein